MAADLDGQRLLGALWRGGGRVQRGQRDGGLYGRARGLLEAAAARAVFNTFSPLSFALLIFLAGAAGGFDEVAGKMAASGFSEALIAQNLEERREKKAASGA